MCGSASAPPTVKSTPQSNDPTTATAATKRRVASRLTRMTTKKAARVARPTLPRHPVPNGVNEAGYSGPYSYISR